MTSENPGVRSLPPTQAHCKITCKTEKDWWDKFKPFIEIAGVILLAVYTGYTVKMYRANRKAAEAADSAAKTAAATLKEIQSSSTDTHELAVQAKNQADRTKDIADRALAQSNATNRLAVEAKRQADIARESMNSNIESAKQDRRPWVGLQLLQCNNCRLESDGSLVIGDLSAMLINTGKSPAIDMVVHWTFESIKATDPIPDYAVIEKESAAERQRAFTIPPNMPPEMAASIAKTNALTERRIAPSKEVLAPNAGRGITIIASLRQVRKFGPIEDQNVVYGLGKITYYDISHTTEHTTMFCVMNDFGVGFRYCPTGNHMD